jgi:hypothetical protein
MRQNLPEIHGGGGQDVRSLNVRILCVFLLSICTERRTTSINRSSQYTKFRRENLSPD